jgi:hypothetical protein
MAKLWDDELEQAPDKRRRSPQGGKMPDSGRNKEGIPYGSQLGKDDDQGGGVTGRAYKKPSEVSTADLGAAARRNEKKTPMPKQSDFPDNASFADALRKWRGTPETSPQKAAIVKKLKEQ